MKFPITISDNAFEYSIGEVEIDVDAPAKDQAQDLINGLLKIAGDLSEKVEKGEAGEG